jgi:hypothetical protein
MVSKENSGGKGKEPSLSEKDFPLEMGLCNNAFNIGEKVSFNATITNKSGRDVCVVSNGFMPCCYVYNIDGTTYPHIETTMRTEQILKAYDQMQKIINHTFDEPPGTYIFEIHYNLEVDGIEIRDKLELTIEVK